MLVKIFILSTGQCITDDNEKESSAIELQSKLRAEGIISWILYINKGD